MTERGQTSVELVVALPLFLLTALVILQLMSVGYSLILADSAAEAAGLAVVVGRDPVAAARAALPRWARHGSRVESAGGRVRVEVETLSPLRLLGIGRRPRVASSAWVRPPER